MWRPGGAWAATSLLRVRAQVLDLGQHFVGEQFQRMPPRLAILDVVKAEHQQLAKAADIVLDLGEFLRDGVG